MKALTENLDWVQSRIEKAQPIEKVGRVVQVTGLIVESDGPEAPTAMPLTSCTPTTP